jgi:hypothetical protein
MDERIQIVAVFASLALLVFVFELVRRRRLLERYALVWIGSSIILLVLAVWSEGLNVVSDLFGIKTPSNGLFFVAVGAIVLLLLHFSVAVSRLNDQAKVLAQRLALLEQRVRDLEPEAEDRITSREDEAPAHATASSR